MTFNSEITLDGMLTVLAVLGSAVAIWMKLNQDVALMKQRVTTLEDWKNKTMDDLEDWKRETTIILRQLERSITILTTIEHRRDPSLQIPE